MLATGDWTVLSPTAKMQEEQQAAFGEWPHGLGDRERGRSRS